MATSSASIARITFLVWVTSTRALTIWRARTGTHYYNTEFAGHQTHIDNNNNNKTAQETSLSGALCTYATIKNAAHKLPHVTHIIIQICKRESSLLQPSGVCHCLWKYWREHLLRPAPPAELAGTFGDISY